MQLDPLHPLLALVLGGVAARKQAEGRGIWAEQEAAEVKVVEQLLRDPRAQLLVDGTLGVLHHDADMVDELRPELLQNLVHPIDALRGALLLLALFLLSLLALLFCFSLVALLVLWGGMRHEAALADQVKVRFVGGNLLEALPGDQHLRANAGVRELQLVVPGADHGQLRQRLYVVEADAHGIDHLALAINDGKIQRMLLLHSALRQHHIQHVLDLVHDLVVRGAAVVARGRSFLPRSHELRGSLLRADLRANADIPLLHFGRQVELVELDANDRAVLRVSLWPDAEKVEAQSHLAVSPRFGRRLAPGLLVIGVGVDIDVGGGVVETESVLGAPRLLQASPLILQQLVEKLGDRDGPHLPEEVVGLQGAPIVHVDAELLLGIVDKEVPHVVFGPNWIT
mmetsp:Transcript_106829/g.309014  ORF Transcript_106829/g.309014 Transcript_106829/m.309014 type:complete len:398 (-) Transcript_106829:243-1436(-)